MRNPFKPHPKSEAEPKNNDDASTLVPPKPLSELILLGRDTTGLIPQSRALTFHLYKSQPALYNLDLSTGYPVLRSGTTTKGPGIAWAQETDIKGEYKILQSRDKLESKFERIGKDDYRWTIPGSQWALKGAIQDDEATLVETTKTFQWLRIPRVEGRVPGFGNPDWKLVDRGTGEVHAVFVEKWDFSAERGEVQFRRSFGGEWEMGVLVTVGVVEEKERVRKSSRGNFTMGMMLWYNNKRFR